MFVEKVKPSLHLLSVQPAAPGQMDTRLGNFPGDNGWVPFRLVQVLEIGKCRAHGASNQDLGLLLIQELLGFVPHGLDAEVPLGSVSPWNRQVQ